MEKVNHIRAFISAVLALLTALWGWFGWLVVAWVASMTLDIATGVLAAKKTGTWASKVMREGCYHKAGSFLVIVLAGILDLVMGLILANLPGLQLPFSYTVLLCPLMLVWYIIAEAGSIIENAGRMGAPVPEWARKAIASLKDTVDAVGDAAAGKESK